MTWDTNATTPRFSSIFRIPHEERQHCYWARLLLNCGFAGLICVFGFVANLLSYWVLCKSRMAPVATFLLRCLALTDNFFVLTWALVFSLKDFMRYIGYSSVTWVYFKLYTFPTVYIAQSATIWLTVVLAGTRYLAVCRPYIAPRLCSLANMKLVVLGVYFYAMAYNLPRFFEVEIRIKNGTGNRSRVYLTDTWLGASSVYKLVYSDILYYIFSFGLPLALLCVLNLRLTLAYRAVQERRRRLRGVGTNRNEQEDSNITLVMITVVAAFLMCQTPARLVQLIWNYQFSTCRGALFYIFELTNILELLNSSINFIIYCLLRKQFRADLKNSVCGQVLRHDDSDASGRLMASTTCANGDVDNKTEITSNV